jgi:tetratricopeptide (TPR) repeat protein
MANNRPGRERARQSARPADLGPAVQAMFMDAMRQHQGGRLTEAAQLYRKILAIDPRHADSLHLLGVVGSQSNNHPAAINLIGQAIRIRADVPFYHVNLGNALQAEGRLDEAVRHYRRALALSPNLAEAHCNLGGTFRKQKRFAEAAAHYQRALALRPEVPEIYNDLGAVLRDQGKLADAAACYEQAIALRPAYAEAHNNRGNVLREQHRLAEAAACYEQAMALRPAYVEAHNNLGIALAEQHEFAKAVTHYERALALRPDYAEAHNNLGNALKHLGRLADAVIRYQHAITLNPAYAEAHGNLGNVLLDQGRFADAVARYECAIALRPELSELHYNLGNALEAQDKLAEAVTHYQRAIALRPGVAEVHNNLGNVLRDLGQLQDAQRAYETAIELAPRTGRFYRHLFETRRTVAADPHLAAMETLARDMPSLPVPEQIELHFALGKVHADLGEYSRAFSHFIEGNALRRRELVYDETETIGLMERIRAVFTPELMHEKRGLGDPAPEPVFIIGMPRSGTTLVEQILAGHPQVLAVGESREMQVAVAGLETDNSGPAFPEIVPALTGEALRRSGGSYVDAVSPPGPETRLIPGGRIIDKMPGNFHFAGLIHLALPNARIIHVRRDPIDTCLSCFTQLFRVGQHHSYDQQELGRYYRAYDALMAHWDRVLPTGIMLEVRYEDVVADVEREARRIVAHCGLEWDSRCLDFHAALRPVRTASAVQVRQPVYATSVGRWRSYGALLSPLIGALGVADDRNPLQSLTASS